MTRLSIRAMSAGQIDSALSSIATFVAGIFAVRVFGPVLLGAYVIVFSAWNVARTIPSELVYVPSEVVAVGRDPSHRILILDSSLRRGFGVSLVASVGVIGSIFIISPSVGAPAAIALALTGAAVTVLAPFLDHWRRMFHIAGVSWRAAVTSGAHLAGTVLSIWVGSALIDPAWIPFGSLAAGFLISGLVAYLLTGSQRRRGIHGIQPPWSELMAIGRWLLIANLAVVLSELILALIAEAVLGLETLGYAEGARVVARPVMILGLGLAAVLGPLSVRAAAERDVTAARAARRVSWIVSIVGGLLYLPVVGVHWAWNPLPSLLPNAYVVEGLVAMSVLAAMIFNIGIPWYQESLGGRRQRGLALSEGIGSVLRIATGLWAPVLQAFTLVVGSIAAWTARAIGLGLITRRGGREPEPVGEADGQDLPPGVTAERFIHD